MVDSITDSTDISLSKLWKIVKDREAWHATVHGGHKKSLQLFLDLVTEQQGQ